MKKSMENLSQILKENQEKLETKKVSPIILRNLRDTYLKITPEANNVDFEVLAQLMNTAFNIYCTGRDLWLLDEPTVEEDIIDLELQYKNLSL
jgi:hypothetical protein